MLAPVPAASRPVSWVLGCGAGRHSGGDQERLSAAQRSANLQPLLPRHRRAAELLQGTLPAAARPASRRNGRAGIWQKNRGGDGLRTSHNTQPLHPRFLSRKCGCGTCWRRWCRMLWARQGNRRAAGGRREVGYRSQHPPAAGMPRKASWPAMPAWQR